MAWHAARPAGDAALATRRRPPQSGMQKVLLPDNAPAPAGSHRPSPGQPRTAWASSDDLRAAQASAAHPFIAGAMADRHRAAEARAELRDRAFVRQARATLAQGAMARSTLQGGSAAPWSVYDTALVHALRGAEERLGMPLTPLPVLPLPRMRAEDVASRTLVADGAAPVAQGAHASIGAGPEDEAWARRGAALGLGRRNRPALESASGRVGETGAGAVPDGGIGSEAWSQALSAAGAGDAWSVVVDAGGGVSHAARRAFLRGAPASALLNGKTGQ